MPKAVAPLPEATSVTMPEARAAFSAADSAMPVYLYLMGPDSIGTTGQAFAAISA